jgi:hypothetical protein
MEGSESLKVLLVALCLCLEFADIRPKPKARRACRRATINYDTPHHLAIRPASDHLPNEIQHAEGSLPLLPHSWRSSPWSSFEQRRSPQHPDPTTTWTHPNEMDYNLAVYIPAINYDTPNFSGMILPSFRHLYPSLSGCCSLPKVTQHPQGSSLAPYSRPCYIEGDHPEMVRNTLPLLVELRGIRTVTAGNRCGSQRGS